MAHHSSRPRRPGARTSPIALTVVLGHHRAQRFAQAEAGYRHLAKQQPEDGDVWHLWGVLAAEQKQLDAAVRRIRRALELKPHEPAFLGNLGNVYLEQRQFGQAIDCFREVAQRQPEDADVRKRLEIACERQLEAGIEHQKGGRLDEAAACYRDVLRGRPEHPDAWHLLGVIALMRDQYEAAAEGIERAIALNPNVGAFHNSLGGLRFLQRRYVDAVASCNEALRLQPDLDGAYRNLGRALRAQRRYAEAETACRTLLRLRPDDPEAYNELGNVLHDAGRRKEAEAAYRKALELRPDYGEVQYNLGILLRRLNRRSEALECFEHVPAGDPRFSYAVGFAADCRARMCDWSDHARARNELKQGVHDGKKCVAPFLFINFCDDPLEQRRCAEIHAQSYRSSYRASPVSREQHRSHDRIRLAYVSPDFRGHPVAYLIADLIERHDRSRFEVFGISIGGPSRSPWRQRLVESFDRFEDVYGASDEDVVQRLRDLQIDIAVDLAGYTASSRPVIFASRAVPIQVNYLGFPGTMGAEFMDYILADRVVIPEQQQCGYAEKVVYLPDTFQCAALREIAERTPTRSELGLPETGFVFCCFNNTYKIQPEFFDVWMRLLARIEGSVLWFRRANESVEDNLRREARARGVDPDRLIFAERVELPEHFARHRQADLFLDTLPYNAHTTASDALWAGLPVLTCMGRAFAGRVGGSLLHAVGLPELVTESLAEYEALALRLASDPQELAALKQKLQRNLRTEALFDVERFRRHVEAAYRQMWEIWQRGDAPAAFAVDPIKATDDRPMADLVAERRSRLPRMPDAEWSHLLSVVLDHSRAGRFAEADAGYRRLLEARPDDPDAWHLWGVLAAQQKQFEAAVERIQRALALKPNEPVFLGNLGNVYLEQRQFGQAIDCFREVAQRQPEDADVRKRLAIACERQLDTGIEHQKGGRSAEAEACYHDVLRGQPQRADAWHLLGAIALERGQYETAEEGIGRAIELAPNVANYHNSLGSLHRKRRRNNEAIACFEKALRLDPDLTVALASLGDLRRAQGQIDQAMAAYRRALELRPGWAEVHVKLGQLLRKAGRLEEAEDAYREALRLRADGPEVHYSLGNLLSETGRAADAEAAYRKAIELRSDYPEAHNSLGNLLFLRHRHEEALSCFEQVVNLGPDHLFAGGIAAHCRASMGQWLDHAKIKQHLLEGVRQGKQWVTPLTFLNLCDDPLAQRNCAEIFAHRYSKQPQIAWQGPRPSHARIRLAYISPDFRSHATAYLIADLIERHDRARFEVIGVSIGPDRRDSWRERLQKGFDRFLEVHRDSDETVIQKLRALEIDIAVDLAGYTTHSRSRILAARVAPLQVNYLGFPGTMGAGFIDYILADRFVIPQADEAYYTEKVVCLPDTYQCNSRKQMRERAPTRRELALPETGFVFCCFNNTHKIHPEFFDIWMRLLNRVEGSVLWLLKGSGEVEGNLRREAATRGVNPERLVFAPRLPQAEHLARQQSADLFLDTLPYNAHTTASDALWAGLPVLTCIGNSFAGRVAGSLLNAVGLPELVTENLAEYEALALRLAGDPRELAALKQKLQRNLSTQPLFDVDRFRRHIEAAYKRMWEIRQRGEAPAAFAVEPIEPSGDVNVARAGFVQEHASPAAAKAVRSATLTLVDGTRVVVPDSLNVIASYVLQEQQDWFEDEIKFLRRVLEPGQTAVDIGANYGVYTLSMANAVGSTGKVWAFEPASTTARLLAESIAVNGFTHVTLERSALSACAGTAELRLNQHSELNSLHRGGPSQGPSETVTVATLDDRMQACGWRDVDLLKIDAEGEESNILKGGERFFTVLSPLVQYEVKAGADLHMDLVQAFKNLGYDSYRLVPGLDLLIPFTTDPVPDAFLLNLFCCKRDRAERLARRGFLYDPHAARENGCDESIVGLRGQSADRSLGDWRTALADLPYGKEFASGWEQTVASGRSSEVLEALSSYARSRDSSLPAAERFRALETSFAQLDALCEREPSHLRLASLARVARDYGARSRAVKALHELTENMLLHKKIDPSEPFLAPSERFDSIPLGTSPADWVFAAVLEALELGSAFSSFYTGTRAKRRLERILALGFASAEMQRRLSLVCRRFGLAASRTAGEYNTNA